MKNYMFLLLSFVVSAQVFSQNSDSLVTFSDPFETLIYDKVIAYNFDYDSMQKRPVHTAEHDPRLDKFNYHRVNKLSVRTVDSALAKELISVLSDTNTYGEDPAACFEPRFGITFFLGNEQVFHVLICFGCNLLDATQTIPASHQKYYVIDTEDESGPVQFKRYLVGFSDAGEEKLLAICKKLNMVYCSN